MELEWDPVKAAANYRKHGVRFTDAHAVLQDPLALTTEDSHQDEERYVTVGLDSLGRILVVCYTWRGGKIRVISARKATRTERKEYEGKR